jgi:hypothetical protein
VARAPGLRRRESSRRVLVIQANFEASIEKNLNTAGQEVPRHKNYLTDKAMPRWLPTPPRIIVTGT